MNTTTKKRMVLFASCAVAIICIILCIVIINANKTENRIIGSWTPVPYAGGIYELVFYKDHSGKYKTKDIRDDYIYRNFAWTVDDNLIYVDRKGVDQDRVYIYNKKLDIITD